MFDKMIESNSAGAEFKPRRTYFLVSSVLVGALFLAAVVVSIYAGDIGLGNTDFELSELLAPLPPADTEPQPEPPRDQPDTGNRSKSDLPSRVINMARVDETQPAPNTTSVTPNQYLAHPPGEFRLRNFDSEAAADPNFARTSASTGDGPGLSNPTEAKVIDDKPVPAPPRITKPEVPRNAAPRSIGVVNGMATSLPKPPYPPTAIAMSIQGKVDVQVTIDERGNVISAKAASGHPFLRPAAEKAAWNARFTPTLLSGVPVKVTGVIVYNFTRN